MLESLKEYRTLSAEFSALDASLRIEMPLEVDKWLQEITKWESTHPYSTPTPYDPPENGMLINHAVCEDTYILARPYSKSG